MQQTTHFLYLEDDSMSRQIAQILFGRVLNYPNLTIFDTSHDFIERLTALPSRPDAIFLDVQVSPHDGFEVLKMLRDHPDYRQTITIAMTANVMSHDVEKLRAAGFNGLIGKPIIPEMFPDLIRRILSGEQVWYVP